MGRVEKTTPREFEDMLCGEKTIIHNGKPLTVVTYRPKTPVRRKLAKITKTWARIPHHRGLELAKLVNDPVLAVLLALEITIHKERSNRVKLTNDLLWQYGITPQSKTRGLRQLAATGVISVEWNSRNGRKTAPMVTHHWYTEAGELIEI